MPISGEGNVLPGSRWSGFWISALSSFRLPWVHFLRGLNLRELNPYLHKLRISLAWNYVYHLKNHTILMWNVHVNLAACSGEQVPNICYKADGTKLTCSILWFQCQICLQANMWRKVVAIRAAPVLGIFRSVDLADPGQDVYTCKALSGLFFFFSPWKHV